MRSVELHFERDGFDRRWRRNGRDEIVPQFAIAAARDLHIVQRDLDPSRYANVDELAMKATDGLSRPLRTRRDVEPERPR